MVFRTSSCKSNRRLDPDFRFPAMTSLPVHPYPVGDVPRRRGDGGDDDDVADEREADVVAADLARLEVDHSEKDCRVISERCRQTQRCWTWET